MTTDSLERLTSPLIDGFPYRPTLIENSYCVSDTLVRFYVYSEHIGNEIRRMFGHFPCAGGKKHEEIKIFIYPSLRADQIPGSHMDGEMVHSSCLYPEVPFNVSRSGDILRITAMNDRFAFLDLKRQEAVCFTPENTGGKRFHTIPNTLLFPIINEIFAQRGQFFFHSASLSRDGCGVLFASSTGGGKSTMALNLLRAGYKLLGDDITILDMRGPKPLFKAFTKDIRICPDTLPMFPEFEYLSGRPLDDGKIQVHPEELFQGCLAHSAEARFVFFLDEMQGKKYDYAPVSFEEALELLAFNALFVMGKHEFHRRLFALVDMLKTAKAYRLRSRMDMNNCLPLIEKIIDG